MLEVNILLLHSVCEGGDLVGGVETFVVGGVNPGELVLALLAPLVDQLLVALQLLLLVRHKGAVVVVTDEGVMQLGVLGKALQRLQDKGTLTAGEIMTFLDVIIQGFPCVELVLTALRRTFLLMLSLEMILNFSGSFEHFLAVETLLQVTHLVSGQLCLAVKLLLTILTLDDMDRVLVDSQRPAGWEAPATLVTHVGISFTGSTGSNNRGARGSTGRSRWSWR